MEVIVGEDVETAIEVFIELSIARGMLAIRTGRPKEGEGCLPAGGRARVLQLPSGNVVVLPRRRRRG